MKVSDQIQIMLETDKVLTAKWLAQELSTTIDNSSKELQNYFEINGNEQSLTCNYLITGTHKLKGLCCRIENIANIEQVKKDFIAPFSLQIFSISQGNSKNTKAYISNLDTDKSTFLLMNNVINEDSISNVFKNRVYIGTIEVKPVGERLLSNSVTSAPKSSVKETTEEHMARVFSNKSVPAAPKSKSSIQASKYFNSNKSSNVTKKEKETKPSPSSKENVLKENVKKTTDSSQEMSSMKEKEEKIMNTNDDEEWDDLEPKLRPKNNKKRKTNDEEVSKTSVKKEEKKKMVTNLENDDSDLDTDFKNSNNDDKKKRKVKETLVRGSMDDYMEDVAIASFKEKQEALANGNLDVLNPKKKKKILVDKMFADERGYLVTETVEEEVTDDESDHPPVNPLRVKKEVTSNNSQVKQEDGNTKEGGKVKAKSAPTGKGKKEAKSAGQKSMMSFFTKK